MDPKEIQSSACVDVMDFYRAAFEIIRGERCNPSSNQDATTISALVIAQAILCAAAEIAHEISELNTNTKTT